MSRLILTGLMAASVLITGCQQQKIGSEPTPAAAPKASPPPGTTTTVVPPRGGGPGPGTPPPTVVPSAGPGPGAGMGPGPGGTVIVGGPGPGPGAPPPAGPGPGPGAPPPPPGYGNGGPPPPPPPSYGPGGTTSYGPGPGAGMGPGPGGSTITVGPGPGAGNGPGPGTSVGNGPGPGAGMGPGPGGTTVITPPTTTTTTVTSPPTTTTTTTTTAPPPNLQSPPTVTSVSLPPQNTYPQTPACVGANCGNQQIIPAPAPAVPMDKPVMRQQIQQPVVQQSAPPAAPPQQQVQPPAQPVAPPPAHTDPTPVEQPPAPVVQQPAPPKPECRDIPVDSELDTTKLDALLVLDTSASMRDGKRTGMIGELGMIAKQIGTFVRGLDPKTDFRIGLMLGHGPDNSKHPGYKHGTLFQTSAGEPAVIDFSKELKACGKRKDARECAIERIISALEKKMHALPTDHSEAQGEALMLSLYDMASNEQLRRGIMKQGLLRKDAVLAVIPISDEQDVCYDYTKCVQTEGESEEAWKQRCTPAQVKLRDAKGKLTGQTGQDPHEVNFYNSVCVRAVNNSPLTPENVLTALQNNLKDGDMTKLAITPIVYLDNSMPVREQDENEMGHGYIELAQLAGGMVADLNSAHLPKGESNFEPILQNFAKFVTTKMTIGTPFTCGSDMHPSAMNLNQMEIQVVDENGQDLKIFKPDCTAGTCVNAQATIGMDQNANYPHVIVKVDEMQLSDALKEHKFSKGKVKIKFKQRPDFNADGTQKQNASLRRRAAHKTSTQQAPAQTQEQHGEENSLLNNMPTDL